ncbi:hypothetical protein [Collimonas sp. OK412]|jgi:hypothetical protein|uniref:hypothetical protein n=1 Tax=Collimonas sp. (strain OK412) TaxID=1801619 RepID=UPI0015876F83|nr:hypothetical protein [Collimonas sp. OK412]
MGTLCMKVALARWRTDQGRDRHWCRYFEPYARLNVYRSSGGTDVARFIGPAATTNIASNAGSKSSELAAGFFALWLGIDSSGAIVINVFLAIPLFCLSWRAKTIARAALCAALRGHYGIGVVWSIDSTTL